MPDLQKLIQNPVMLASSLLLLATACLLLLSLGLLGSAFLYSPQAQVYTTSAQPGGGHFSSQAISERNFFGLAKAEPELTAMDNLPETTLALILRGAFAGGDQDSAGAIIENEETKVADHYAVGESLPGDAVLKAIYADRVVLNRNGLLETLYFPDIADSSGIGAVKNVNSGRAVHLPPPESDAAIKRREAIRERIKQLRKR